MAPSHASTSEPSDALSARPRWCNESQLGTPIVAMVTDAIAPYHRGGKEQRYLEVAPRLTRFADVHVYTMRWWDGRKAVERDGVTYHAISPFLPLYARGRRSVLQAIVFALACLRLLTVAFDVIEADHMPYLQLFPLKLVALIRRRRLVVTWHEVWGLSAWIDYLGPFGRVAWWLERCAMRLPDAIVAASPQTATRLERHLRGRVKVVVAPNGIDLDRIRKVDADQNSSDLVSVGRFLSHKRFDLLLDAVALLANRGQPFRCRIIGDGPEREALVVQANRLGIGHLVEFRCEIMPHDDLLALVKSARAFVLPSEREGFGIAALEAIACGVPVIATDARDNLARHLVDRSARGIVCKATLEALASSIAQTMASQSPATDGADAWVTEYDWESSTRTIAQALRQA